MPSTSIGMLAIGGSDILAVRPGSCTAHTSTSVGKPAGHDRKTTAPTPAYGKQNSRTAADWRGVGRISQGLSPALRLVYSLTNGRLKTLRRLPDERNFQKYMPD